MSNGVATSPIPLALIAGKDFDHSWVVATSATGEPESLADIGAVEFRASRIGDPNDAVVWSLGSGIEIVADEMVLHVAGDDTEDLSAGDWRWLLSYGESEPEIPLVKGTLTIEGEP